MAEELTREVIQAIVKETIQASSQSSDFMWIIPTLGLLATITGLTFTMYRFNETQKQSNKTQERNQNLEFMKQLEYYDNLINSTKEKFMDSPQTYEHCKRYATQKLDILERMAFVKSKKLMEFDLQFFQNEFNHGRTLLNWVEKTGKRTRGWKTVFPYFRKMKETLEYTSPGTRLDSSFYYYLHKFESNSDYDPQTDKDCNPETYDATPEDLQSVRPGNQK